MPPSNDKGKSKKHAKQTKNSPAKLQKSNAQPRPTSEPPYLIPEFFLVTFKQLFTSAVGETIQRVKGHLYERDYAAAFGCRENLEAYAVRWSVSRALAYRDMVVDEWWGSRATELFKHQAQLAITSIGGGAGAEVVGFAAARKSLGASLLAEKSVDASSKRASATDALGNVTVEDDGTHGAQGISSDALHISCMDIADWAPIIATITSSVTIEPPLTGESNPRKHSLCLSPSSFSTSVQKGNVLDPNCTISSLETADIITILFTAGELYSQNPREATKFLLTLHAKVKKPGALLIVVDSAGGFENLDIRKERATTEKSDGGSDFKLGFVLDRTLESHGHWSKIVSEDARWWRVPEELQSVKDKSKGPNSFSYPLPLENMRCLVRVYERAAGT